MKPSSSLFRRSKFVEQLCRSMIGWRRRLALLWLARSSVLAPPAVDSLLLYRLRLDSGRRRGCRRTIYCPCFCILVVCVVVFFFLSPFIATSWMNTWRVTSRSFSFLLFSLSSVFAAHFDTRAVIEKDCSLSSTHVFDLSRRVFDSPPSFYCRLHFILFFNCLLNFIQEVWDFVDLFFFFSLLRLRKSGLSDRRGGEKSLKRTQIVLFYFLPLI